ncbi:hypothetical protein [Arthrobacter sp. MDT1-65]
MASPLARQAAAWVLNLEDPAERSRLYNHHRMLRQPSMERGYHTTDHKEADAWLIQQWQEALGEIL